MEHSKRQLANTKPTSFLTTVALCLAAIVLIFRGPIPALKYSDDYMLMYAPARAWLTGGNPYDVAAVDAAWLSGGGRADLPPSSRHDGALLYPPTTLLLLAPFAALPWAISKALWMATNVCGLALAVVLIARLGGLRRRAMWLFASAAMVFMPVHSAIWLGQTPLLVLALILVGLAGWRVRPASGGAAAGATLGLGVLLKPQIGLPFLALDVLRRRWASLGAAMLGILLLTAAAIVPLIMRGIPWWSNWRANLGRFTEGSVGDPTMANPVRHQLLNLHVPLHAFIESRATVTAIVFATVAVLAIIFFRTWIVDFLRRPLRHEQKGTPGDPHARRESPAMLLTLSMIAVLSLMIVYHRFYDAVLLLLPLGWAITAISARRNNLCAWSVAVLLIPFFLNSGTALATLESRAVLPSWILDQWWWNGVVKTIQPWALLLMATVLIVVKEKRTSALDDRHVVRTATSRQWS